MDAANAPHGPDAIAQRSLRATAVDDEHAFDQRGRDWSSRRVETWGRFARGEEPTDRKRSRASGGEGAIPGRDAAPESLGQLEESGFSRPLLIDQTAAWQAIAEAHETAAKFEEHARDTLPIFDGRSRPPRRGQITLDR